ncbi:MULTISPECIES: carbohydrate ABC transporter permease [Kribbella]|jgi:multiple sugar transport system permease protein/putative aldouronate transport system permease protein|uniref:Carbohydrate ABC transporter membrane protein 2 (CUT1 family) n=1 Tax=Kribbella pratensis TaxID=2512112 RepID=A0ABY2FAV3_9ACTN|nr:MULTISPECIES: carbohydrate ABC transporter permease [Kribbella]TDW87709.1 carbohydrate ABC transporter membrane protein 2 (CUT1 family) [Kribbella pratensis]TDW89094.1 carbohydrate ABC transporter membrane protein 2 (CUT1 family) [Kribbella sp. VKM Ac-2566]
MSTRIVQGVPMPGWPMRIFKGLVLLVFCAVVIVPFVGVISTSVAPNKQINESGGLVLLPKSINFGAYESLFAGGVVTRALFVSIFVTIVGTLLSLTVSCLLAYALSRPGFVAGRPILLVVLFSMLFSPGIIPLYLTVKGVGLLDSIWALIVPTMISAFNVVVLRAFFMNLPNELTESARIDGAGELKTFTNIVLPLSKAVLSVIGLFYAVAYWNAFFSALLYLNDSKLWPLQLVLRTYVINDTQLGSAELGTELLPPQASIQMAILVVSIVPILVIYPFLQRHFAKGVLTGAVKG